MSTAINPKARFSLGHPCSYYFICVLLALGINPGEAVKALGAKIVKQFETNRRITLIFSIKGKLRKTNNIFRKWCPIFMKNFINGSK